MAVPSWAQGPTRGRPETVFSSGKKSERPPDPSRPENSRDHSRGARSEPVRLGKTTGVMAVGAWSARLEIARLLEAGVPAREILRSIKSGEEGEDPLESAASPDVSTPRSTSAGVKRPLEVGSTSSSARASSAPRLSSQSGNTPGLPGWAGSSLSTLEFSKKATKPRTLEDDLESFTPEDREDTELESREASVEKEVLTSAFSESKKRAQPPPPDPKAGERDLSGRNIPRHLPKRANLQDSQRLDDFRKMARAIFEDLVLLDVKMDIVDPVFNGREIDSEKFNTLTDPRNPKTGLRYARLMSSFIQEYKNKHGSDHDVQIFGLDWVQEKILDLIARGVGHNTPQALIYAIEHFSVIFGFNSPVPSTPDAASWPTTM